MKFLEREKMLDDIFKLANEAESYYNEEDYFCAVLKTIDHDNYDVMEFFTDDWGMDINSVQSNCSMIPINSFSSRISKRKFMESLLVLLPKITREHE